MGFWLIILAVIILAFKLWMVGGHEMLAKFRPHDDSLFATLAISLLEGNWLGDYNNKTLIKGVGYPFFMAVSAWLGVPLLTLQQLLYGLACALVVVALKPVVRSPIILFLVFLLLLFNPLSYSYPLMSATLRASLYLSLSLIVFASMLGLWNHRMKPGWPLLWWSVCMAVSLTWLFVTREESVWIIPGLLVFVILYLLPFSWNRGSVAVFRVISLVLPLIVFVGVQQLIVHLNFKHYGVAVSNELKSEEFVSALGGLMRIKHQNLERHVIVSKDAQSKAFRASPTFAELEPYLSGESKMLASFYIWSLRSAVRRAGYYNNPSDATREFEFYKKVGQEIKAACESKVLDCHDRSASIRPLWHSQYNSQALPVFWELATTALTGSLFKASSQGLGSKEDLDTLFNYDVLTGENTLRKSIYF